MPKDADQIVVEAVGLKKIFYDFWHRPKAAAVNGINFEVKQGQVLGFLGPNGSGKSTTVKMILGLLRPTSGSLRTFGRPPAHVATKLRIGYLPEETYLYKYLTAAETLDFFAALFRLSTEQRKNRTRELLRMVGMERSGHRPVGEFSKGMARRIGLAQALINDPDLVILDEPTSGLDPIGCREIKDIIKTLAKRGKTVILCSHLLADVQDVCDHVLIMYGGQIRAQGSLNELLSVEDKTQITAPRLPADVLQRILDLIHEVEPDLPTAVDNPTKTLEQFFMDVVNQARSEATSESAGVEQSGEIASFLAGTDRKQSGEILLKSLVESATAPATTDEPEPEEAPTPDLLKLEELIRAEIEPEAEAAPQADQESATNAPRLSPDERLAKSKAIQDLLDK